MNKKQSSSESSSSSSSNQSEGSKSSSSSDVSESESSSSEEKEEVHPILKNARSQQSDAAVVKPTQSPFDSFIQQRVDPLIEAEKEGAKLDKPFAKRASKNRDKVLPDEASKDVEKPYLDKF